MAPPTDLLTSRLRLRASDPALALELAAYLQRNRLAHAPWNPPMPDQAFTEAGQRERLAAAVQAEAAGTQRAWFLCPLEDDAKVIGHLRFSQIAHGPFQNAMLGYAIDAAHEGQGLMHEALCAALAEAFGPRMGLHRVQANVRPENRRSLALLDRLGFEREGIARQYLYIDGAWRDHLMTALRHPHWPVDQAPA